MSETPARGQLGSSETTACGLMTERERALANARTAWSIENYRAEYFAWKELALELAAYVLSADGSAQTACPNPGCGFFAGHESEHPCGHPYESEPRTSSIRYETSSLDIPRRRQDALSKLSWCLLVARRSLGLRPLRRRVVARRDRLCGSWRWHLDRRGITVTVPHPEAPDTFRVDILSVRWGRRGRGVHPQWEWIEKVANA